MPKPYPTMKVEVTTKDMCRFMSCSCKGASPLVTVSMVPGGSTGAACAIVPSTHPGLATPAVS